MKTPKTITDQISKAYREIDRLRGDINQIEHKMQQTNAALDKSLRKIPIAKLEEELKRVCPDGLVEKFHDAYRFKMHSGKPWGAAPHAETMAFTRKGIYIAALEKCVRLNKQNRTLS